MGILPADLCSQYDANISRQEFCRVLAGLLRGRNFTGAENPSGGAAPFSDTDNADVVWLSSLGVVKGVGVGVFNPSGSISRQEAAVMLKRAALVLGAADTAAQTNFQDGGQVADWARDALGFVVANGIMKGTGDDVFSPLGMYTRQQSFVTMMRLYDAVPGTGG
jgi:hypothetical protein